MGAALRCAGVYKPRRPRASPLYRLVEAHFPALHAVYDERFAETYGAWRPVMRKVTERFLTCGILEHGFARVRCGSCAHEYLLAFSCKRRYSARAATPSGSPWGGLWLEETLLAPVPHRQVVLTIPKRLRAYCLYRRSLLGEIAHRRIDFWPRIADVPRTRSGEHTWPTSNSCRAPSTSSSSRP